MNAPLNTEDEKKRLAGKRIVRSSVEARGATINLDTTAKRVVFLGALALLCIAGVVMLFLSV